MNGIAGMDDVLAIERACPRLPASTYEMIRSAAAAHAKAPALSIFLRAQDHERPTTWNYETLLARITATANFFHGLGIGKDDVVAFVLPNLPETHLTIWGGQAAGIVFAINPLLEPAAIGELLRAGGAKVLVTLAPFPGTDLWSKLQPIVGEVPGLRHLVLVNPAQHLPAAASPRSADFRNLGVDLDRISVHDFAEGIRGQPTDRLVSGRVIASEDLSSYFCTGGTTGTPKIAMRRHANEVANAWSVGQVLGSGMDAGKTIFCGLPLFHVNAVLVTGLLPFSRGAHVLLGTPQGYRGEGVVARFWEMVERHRINLFSGVPTLYASLLQVPIAGRDVSSLEYGICGAAPMPLELMRSFQERTGLKILEGYGLTEGTCVSTVNPPRGERPLGSIGLRVPLQAMKAVLLDDAGAYLRDCAVDEVGVLVIRGPNVFAGYRVAEHNRGLWVDAGDGERWLNTGDLGRQDAQGYFYLTGRKKELIIRGGHNIDPASIEQPLHQHPAVLIAAAVGRPDAHAGEIPVAYVQLKPGAAATEADLMNFTRDRIAERAAAPKAIRIIPAMPLTGIGKIFKPELKLREIEDSLGEALRGAAVPFKSLKAHNDPTHGTLVEVALAEGADAQFAHRVLGQFPYRFRLKDVRSGSASTATDPGA
jgi:fatty-acyl-CoA synthase